MTEIANADQQAAWNGDSGHHWVADAERRDRVMAPIAGAMLAAAGLRSGEQVADLGCGSGATTLAAAVAPGGHVVGIDMSGPALELAPHTSWRAARLERDLRARRRPDPPAAGREVRGGLPCVTRRTWPL
jgi:trans-aconitate methyltransferase